MLQGLNKANASKRLIVIARELLNARTLESLKQIVKKAARELTGSDGSTFILKEGELCFYADEDTLKPLWKGHRFPIRQCISGWTIMNRKVAVIQDVFTDPRVPHDAYRPTFVKSLAMVPINMAEPVGAIGNYWADNHLATPDEVNVLQTLADLTASALENIKSFATLEQSLKERTGQLQTVNQELETLAYSISHDLRSPLRSIVGYSNILEEDHYAQLPEEGKKVLHTITQSASKMDRMMEDLLEYSRLSQRALQIAEIPVEDIVKRAVADISAAQPHNAKITIDSLPSVTGDFSLLQQAWINLIKNAIKFSSGKENPMIHIGSYAEENNQVYFIRDNGSGFNMESVHRLFGVFQKLHKSSDFEGGGLGLAIVKRIASKLGGSVWAEGKTGEGATFYFSLPLKN